VVETSLKRLVLFAAWLAILAAIVWNVRFGIADLLARRNQPDSTRLAMRLAPANSAYAAQLADEIYAGDPESARSLLQRAVQLNRYDASSWIQLGLLYEAANDSARAEEALGQAAQVDATFLPGWSLANFYFRHNDVPRFWFWAQRAAQMAPGDTTALFRLAWYASPSAGEIESRLQLRRPEVEGQFVDFLRAQGDPSAVTVAAMHLLAAGNPQSTEILLGACDWLIEEKRPELALPLWNGLAARRQISYAPVETGLVTNGGFSKSPISRGFDWRLATVAGVSSFLNDHPNALGFEFSGEEPDGFLIMHQAAAVRAGKKYALLVDYRTTGIAGASGLAWSVTDVRSGEELGRTASLSADQGGRAVACFLVNDGAGFVDLALRYQRQPGTVRVEGKLELHGVSLSGATVENCPGSKMSHSGADSPAF
jgi:tetratricopeptide (TPR) repeat protein